MTETWKAVPGFEGLYEVSDMGRVRTVERTVTGFWGRGRGLKTRLVRQHEMRAYVNTARGGYRYVNLHKDGLQHMRRVAVLVAAAFLGPRPEGRQVCHCDGNPANDVLANLRYGTPKENSADKLLHGTQTRGEQHVSARLTHADVVRIKTGREAADVLAAEFGVHPGHINNIRRGVRWTHV